MDHHVSTSYIPLFDEHENLSSATHSPMQKNLLSTQEFNFSFSGAVSGSDEILGQGEQRESGFSPSSKVEKQTIPCSPRKNPGLNLLSIECFESPHTTNEMDHHVSTSYIPLFDEHENLSSATHSPMQKNTQELFQEKNTQELRQEKNTQEKKNSPITTQEFIFSFSGAVSAKF